MVPDDSAGIPRVPAYSGSGQPGRHASRTGPSPSAARRSIRFRSLPPKALSPALQPRTPRRHGPGLGSSPFARRYWGNRFYFLFLRVLRCFSSPRWRPLNRGRRDRSRRVAPFGNPRIKGHLPLPAAYRSLSRPSSPPRAKASPMRPWYVPLSFFQY